VFTYRVATFTQLLETRVPLDTSVPLKGVTSAITDWADKGWELFAIESLPANDYHLTCLLTFRKEA
jgi:hypothetical protein